ncbi:hypothetical protein L7F22_039328 [Adiantum nelumboides]|nr:hypothetical protein [Adiantum nelumboides]
MDFETFKANQLLVLPPNPEVDFSGKRIIITGANAGIGYELVRYYLKQNAKQIVMVCRSMEKAEKAKERLLKEANRKDDGVITIELMNMLSFDSVKACADKLNATLDSVHVIHHNAGMACVPKQLSKDGYETV